MFQGQWIYDFLIYSLLISLLFSFADLMKPNPHSRSVSLWLLIIVWIGVTMLGLSALLESTPTAASLYFAWTFLTISLLGKKLFHRDLLSFSLTVLGLAALFFYVYFGQPLSSAEAELRFSKLIIIHIALAFMAYAAFLVSGLGSVFYLLCSFLLKKKKWNRWLMRLPSLDHLQWFSYWLIAVGFMFLLISLPLGVFWANETMPEPIWLDLKFWTSILLLCFYGYLLYRWLSSTCHGKLLARFNSLALILLLFNFFISKTNLSFHNWAY